MNNYELLSQALSKISPTYSKGTKCLPKDLKKPVSIGNALYRSMDLIEDLIENDTERQKLFDELFLGMKNTHPVNNLHKALVTIAETEQDTTTARLFPVIIDCYKSLEENVKQAIFEEAKNMRRGMNKSEITTLNDQNKYCDAAACTVGGMLTKIFYATSHIDENRFQKLLKNSHNIGRALQKMNIIRDVKKDNAFYWPAEMLESEGLDRTSIFLTENVDKAANVKSKLLDDAKYYLDTSLQYIRDLPRREHGIRLFCMLGLFNYALVYNEARKNNRIFAEEISMKKDLKNLLPLIYLSASSNTLVEELYNHCVGTN